MYHAHDCYSATNNVLHYVVYVLCTLFMYIALTTSRLLRWTHTRWLQEWTSTRLQEWTSKRLSRWTSNRLSRWTRNSGLPRWNSSSRLPRWLESRWPHISWVHHKDMQMDICMVYQKVLHKDGDVDGNLNCNKVGTEFGSQEQILICYPRLKLTQLPRTNSDSCIIESGIGTNSDSCIFRINSDSCITGQGARAHAYKVSTDGTDTYGQYG